MNIKELIVAQNKKLRNKRDLQNAEKETLRPSSDISIASLIFGLLIIPFIPILAIFGFLSRKIKS